MEELTCSNCNCDVDEAELKQNNLRCPTCGFDMSDIKDPEDFNEEDEDEDDDEEEKDEDEEEEDEE